MSVLAADKQINNFHKGCLEFSELVCIIILYKVNIKIIWFPFACLNKNIVNYKNTEMVFYILKDFKNAPPA